ncbi:MAG: nuclear transport factor 2 family protein [Candidatus Heimdallarchaeota archaeon]|nr:nuclear transport factor 2 family protein [Candidatus Heimdallarchaeota archaeon]
MNYEEEAVKNAFFKFSQAFIDGNLQTVLSSYSKNSPVNIDRTARNKISKGLGELIELYKKAMREWQARGVVYEDKIRDRVKFLNLKVRNDIAWFSILNTPSSSEIKRGIETLRITAVMEKVDQEWKILQIHYSVPDARTHEGSWNPSKTAIQSTIEGWIRDFDINPNLSQELKDSKLKEYLQKAQSIMQESLAS